jgi:excisionase family DNA binding protein
MNDTAVEVPRLLKVADVADRLDVGIDWVYERIKRGEIPVVELGDTRKNQRVPETALAAFINERTYGK